LSSPSRPGFGFGGPGTSDRAAISPFFETRFRPEERRDPAVAGEDEVAEEDLFLFGFEQVVLTHVAQVDPQRIVRRRGLHGFRLHGCRRFDQRLFNRELVLLAEDRIVVQKLGGGLFLVLDWHVWLSSGDRIVVRASSRLLHTDEIENCSNRTISFDVVAAKVARVGLRQRRPRAPDVVIPHRRSKEGVR
jgi:hypothetical protein